MQAADPRRFASHDLRIASSSCCPPDIIIATAARGGQDYLACAATEGIRLMYSGFASLSTIIIIKLANDPLEKEKKADTK